MKSAKTNRSRAGFTINEILVATAIMTVVLLACFSLMQRDTQLQRSSLGISLAETKAQEMLYKLERELSDARGEAPRATLTMTLSGSATGQADVDLTLGFPDRGLLLIDRSGNHEFVAYDALGGPNSFDGLTRGVQCSGTSGHPAGTEVLWGGIAEPIAIQTNPPASMWDGRSQEATGPVFFRGTGSGFSYRVPTDDAGGNDYLDGDDLKWGETVNGVPTLAGWGAVHFEPAWIFDESTTSEDINKDGDKIDLFDVGQIRRRTWDTSDPTVQATDVGLGPTVVIQEQCNWGGDLDGDGFADPIFLWDASARTLHVRLFILGTSVSDLPIVRRVESVIFLRNEPGT